MRPLLPHATPLRLACLRPLPGPPLGPRIRTGVRTRSILHTIRRGWQFRSKVFASRRAPRDYTFCMATEQGSRKRTGGGHVPTPTREIPDKLYFRIGEVAKLCDVPAYVLRFWESEFPQLKPNKGGTGQRLYRRRDVEMALRIKTLLYDEGYTIPGARAAFKAELRGSKDPQLGISGIAETVDAKHLVTLRKELQDIHALLSKPALAKTVQPIRRAHTLPTLEKLSTAKPPAPREFPRPRLMPAQTMASSLFDALPPED